VSGTDDTIFALSSGALPAAIAVVRISGRCAGAALTRLAGRMPPPRLASTMRLRGCGGELLDQALVLWLPGPRSATGEDMVELQLHGGRATVAVVLAALERQDGLRPADPGEFTRRALTNGRMDLTRVEGLGDLLAAETEGQRRAALRLADGALGRMVERWQDRLLRISAAVEARIEFAEDQDEPLLGVPLPLGEVAALAGELREMIASPPAERLRDGVRIVVAGPVNAGKSSLVNALAGRDVAIATSVAGTTRDVIEVPLVVGGVACLLIDGAGLREAEDEVERIGVARARAAIATADLLLWLGEPASCPSAPVRLIVQSQCDRPEDRTLASGADLAVSATTGEGLDQLRCRIVEAARRLLPPEDRVAVNQRHRLLLEQVAAALDGVEDEDDMLLLAERLRSAQRSLDRITGAAGTEAMLDRLFAGFCIGK